MHDLRWIRENPEEFDRGLDAARSAAAGRARSWRSTGSGALRDRAPRRRRRARNRLSREVGAAKKRGEAIEELLRQTIEDKDAEATTAAKAADCASEIDEILAGLPNLPAAEVPDGPDESANRVLRHPASRRSSISRRCRMRRSASGSA